MKKKIETHLLALRRDGANLVVGFIDVLQIYNLFLGSLIATPWTWISSKLAGTRWKGEEIIGAV